MEASKLAAFVFGVDSAAVLAAGFESGALVAVIDRGIAGAPKVVLGAPETMQAMAQYATQKKSGTGGGKRRTRPKQAERKKGD